MYALSRTRRVLTVRHPGLTLVVLLATVAFGATTQPGIAVADTARIVPQGRVTIGKPMSASLAITAVDGQVRTLGPYRFRGAPSSLAASPDGRFLAVGFELADPAPEVTIVPTDGSGPFALRATPRSLMITSTSDFSWSADGNELIIGGAEDRRAPRDRWQYHSAALRCAVVTRACQRIPDSEGLAAAIPGGIVTSTALDDVLPSTSQLGRVDASDSSTVDARPSRQNRFVRKLLREIRQPERTRTTLVSTVVDPPATTTVTTRTARLTAGADAAVSVLGGPSGALIVHDRHRVTVTRHGKKLRLRSQTHDRRWTVVAPDGTRRTRPMRVFLVPKADAPTHDWGRRLPRQRAGAVPSVAVPTGGWLGTVGFVRGNGPGGYLLAWIAPTGRAELVRTRRQVVSARNLVRTVLGRSPTPSTASLDIVGYETASNAAIVTLDWSEGPPDESIAPGGNVDPGGVVESRGEPVGGIATVRVPLDGLAAPTIVSRTREQAAW